MRKRTAFADFEEARLHARSQVNCLAGAAAEVGHPSGEERLAYVRARAAVAEFDLAVDSAAVA